MGMIKMMVRNMLFAIIIVRVATANSLHGVGAGVAATLTWIAGKIHPNGAAAFAAAANDVQEDDVDQVSSRPAFSAAKHN